MTRRIRRTLTLNMVLRRKTILALVCRRANLLATRPISVRLRSILRDRIVDVTARSGTVLLTRIYLM